MPEKRAILVIEDDHAISNFICRALTANDYKAIPAASGKEGLSLFFSHSPDLVLLDLGLPDMDGLEVLEQFSDLPQEVPTIIISARDRESEKVRALDMGADDYVVKPFSPKEVLARINAIIKRNKSGNEPVGETVKFEGLEINFTARDVFIDGEKANLTPKEYDLLFYLVKNKNIALTRNKLLEEVWGYDFFGDDRTIDTHIKMLRNNLGPYRKFIVTLRGMGYKFQV